MDGKETVLRYGMCSNCGVPVGKDSKALVTTDVTLFHQNVPCVFLKSSLFFCFLNQAPAVFESNE